MLTFMRTGWRRVARDGGGPAGIGTGVAWRRLRLCACALVCLAVGSQLVAKATAAPAGPPPAPLTAPPPPPPKAPPPPPPAAPPPAPPEAPGATRAATGTTTAAAPSGLVSLVTFLVHDSGVIGRDDVAVDPQARHIPPGALDAPTQATAAGPSHAALVVVGIEGRAVGRRPTLTLDATSKKDGSRLLHTSTRLPPLDPRAPAAIKIPFVLHDVGCDSVRLVATISPAAKGDVARFERLLPLHCGS
jgi:hypothetical protein